MLAANTTFQIRTNRTPLFRSHTNQLAYTVLVKHLEWVYFQNLLFQINRKERSNIITRITECHLC